uniref:PDZ domain-containing protein n=1 Tax=Macrostomum lignano TaxID=282301 RepID=A0A1I8F5V5_9PLAT
NIYISRVTPTARLMQPNCKLVTVLSSARMKRPSPCSQPTPPEPRRTMDLVRELRLPPNRRPGPAAVFERFVSSLRRRVRLARFPVEEITLALDDGSTGQPQQMGLSICGGCDYASHPFGTTEPGVFVSRIVPGGAASRTNLRVGDRILAVNGRDLRQAAHHEAVAALKENRYRLKLRVRHDPPPAGMRTLTIHRVDKTKEAGHHHHWRGMRLLEVNGRTLLGVSRQEAASILRDLPAEIRVVICDGFPAEPAGKQQPQARPRQDPSRPRLESTTSIDRDEEVENLKGLQAQ